MPRHVGFRIGDVLKPGDVLSEWVVTVAMAANDCAFAGSIFFGDTELGQRSYAARIAVAHLFEACEYLDATAGLPQVEAFVATLPDVAEDYALVLDTYRTHRSQLAIIRSNGVFHYPKWKPTPRKSNMTAALELVEDSLGIVRLGDTIMNERFLFADEIVSALLERICPGGASALAQALAAASDALGAFATFANTAVTTYITEICDELAEYELSDDGTSWQPV